MKFTKEDAYKELVSQMTAKGEKLNLSERSINAQLENLMTLVANEEMELTDFLSKTIDFFRTADANVRHDVSAGIKDYKDKNPIVEPPKPKEKSEEDMSEWEKRIAALENEIAEKKRNETIAGIKSQIITQLNEKGVKDNKWINTLLSEVAISEDFDVNNKVETYLSMYNKSQARINPNATPDGTGGGGDETKELGDFIKGVSNLTKSMRLD